MVNPSVSLSIRVPLNGLASCVMTFLTPVAVDARGLVPERTFAKLTAQEVLRRLP